MSWTGTKPSQWVAKTEHKLDLAVRKISLEMFTKVILRTPVDEGRARANWMVGIGNIPSGTVEFNDPSGMATVSKTQAAVMGVKAGDTITLANNLPYAQELEEGHSQQAPNGMVALTVQEFQTIAAKVGVELQLM